MPRLIAFVLAACLTLSSSLAVSAQLPAEDVLADLDVYWAGQFAANGLNYWSPGILVLGDPIATSCGILDSSFGPGAYCGADATIYYAPVWFMGFESTGSEYATMTVLAHEWGHHVQLLLGIPWSPDKSYELQADCLSGVYARNAESRGLAPSGALADAIRLAALSGDTGYLPRDAPAHGSGAERAIAFMNGYDQGIGSCGLPLW